MQVYNSNLLCHFSIARYHFANLDIKNTSVRKIDQLFSRHKIDVSRFLYNKLLH